MGRGAFGRLVLGKRWGGRKKEEGGMGVGGKRGRKEEEKQGGGGVGGEKRRKGEGETADGCLGREGEEGRGKWGRRVLGRERIKVDEKRG